MNEEVKDKKKITIIDLLKSHPEGLTITDIMNRTGLARHTVLARLHNLVGKEKVDVRKINMAKVHYWKEDMPSEEELKEVLGKKAELKPLEEKHIKESPSRKPKIKEKSNLDMKKIKEKIENNFGKLEKTKEQILEQRSPIKHTIDETKEYGKNITIKKDLKKKDINRFFKTGIEGLDELLIDGIPKESSILVAGGAGSGKTIMCLQIVMNSLKEGKRCLYMSFEESEEKLRQHMKDFVWGFEKYEKNGNLLIQRFNPFDITRNVDALLSKAKGELLIDIEPVILPKDFNPEIIVIDSLTAIASAFVNKEESYRVYIEQLFRFFEKLKASSFLITETKQIPTVFSTTGVEEFLADGVIVLYSIKKGNVRENAIEILKLRGANHQKRIVAMQITSHGFEVYPEQEVFAEIKEGGF